MSQRKARSLRLGLPKGSLQETTMRLFTLAGFDVRVAPRSYYPDLGDPELDCILIRAQEMARYVDQGVLDVGITGLDWTIENRAKVKELADLRAPWPNYGPVRWIVAVKSSSKIRRPADLEGKRIATEVVGLTRRYLKQHGVNADIEFSWGATEVKPPLLADAIVDVTETGSSLRANDLRVIDTVLESTPRFIANRSAYADAWKRRKMERLLMMLRGAIRAVGRVGLMLNAPEARLGDILKILPALDRPTVSHLANRKENGKEGGGEAWVAVNTIVEESWVRDLVPKLSEAGARGIVEYPLNKIIE